MGKNVLLRGIENLSVLRNVTVVHGKECLHFEFIATLFLFGVRDMTFGFGRV